MTRLARVVVPALPHHVLQRGVRSMALFTSDAQKREPVLICSIGDWRTLLRTAEEPTTTRQLEQQLRTGRPQGAEAFVQRLEQTLGRPIRKRRPGPQLAGVR